MNEGENEGDEDGVNEKEKVGDELGKHFFSLMNYNYFLFCHMNF